MSKDQDAPPNEILAAARAAKDRELAAKRRTWPIAVGIGSAALAAALIYAKRRGRDGD